MQRNKQIIKALGLYVKSKKYKSYRQFTTPALGGSISGDIILSDKYYFTDDDNENNDCIYVQRNTVIKRSHKLILKHLTTLFIYHRINGSLLQLGWSKYNIVRC